VLVDGADGWLGRPFGITVGVSGGASVDLDLRGDGRERAELVALPLALGVLFAAWLAGVGVFAGKAERMAGPAACLRRLPATSSTVVNSSGSLSTSWWTGDTVPTTLRGRSIECVSLLWSGLSSSGSPSSSRACAAGERRFLLPSCGVANALGVACRRALLLACTDALRGRVADLLAARGVCCWCLGVGVRWVRCGGADERAAAEGAKLKLKLKSVTAGAVLRASVCARTPAVCGMLTQRRGCAAAVAPRVLRGLGPLAGAERGACT
jgi:hypothetical protein